MTLTYTPTDTTQPWDNAGTGSFTVNVGTPSVDRIVVISFLIASNTDANLSPLSVAINGSAANVAVSQIGDTSSSMLLGIAYLPVPTGSTAKVLLTCPFPVATAVVAGIITGDASAVLGPTAANALAATNDPQSTSAAVPSGGVAVFAADIYFPFSGGTPSWTGATNDASLDGGGVAVYDTLVSAHGTSSNPSFTGANGYDQFMIMATFGPSGAPASYVPHNPWPQIGPLLAQ